MLNQLIADVRDMTRGTRPTSHDLQDFIELWAMRNSAQLTNNQFDWLMSGSLGTMTAAQFERVFGSLRTASMATAA